MGHVDLIFYAVAFSAAALIDELLMMWCTQGLIEQQQTRNLCKDKGGDWSRVVTS